ncbi:RagB/SusD family nutrient uptake outer membrane protein [Sphingobacterium sp. E70]|nr:RagB/SusD family nutrient uptake outer membrane protein [Sphingobacterium sp. E70]ULT26758.1 RagB/SusD family nutrient uptake outer membrane protein [Sphingobacterium sp. E70]
MTTDNHLEWYKAVPRSWEDKQYLYPLPATAIVKNSNLIQNPGWTK